MDYPETLSYLYAQLPMFQRVGAQAYKKDLTNIRALCKALGSPQDTFSSIHIAGTNGKGSVSSMLASILAEAGYRTGLYTSPHLREFTERIRVDGAEITEDAVVRFVERHKALIEDISPSFFEVTVAMAFDYFRETGVEAAVVEVGMGGRLDSTNILEPVAAAITNISFDHAQHLGDTLALIAGEKAGIMKPGLPVVIGEARPETLPVFEAIAARTGARLVAAQERYRPERIAGDLRVQTFRVYAGSAIAFDALETDLTALYQRDNLATTLCLTDLLREQGLGIPAEAVVNGLRSVKANTGFRGRLSVLGEAPLTVADVSHNEAGIRLTLSQVLAWGHPGRHFVWGMVDDKDAGKVLEMLPKNARYYFVRPDVPRGLDAETLAGLARARGLQGEVYASVGEGLTAARSAAGPEDLVFVGGSTFVVAEVI